MEWRLDATMKDLMNATTVIYLVVQIWRGKLFTNNLSQIPLVMRLLGNFMKFESQRIVPFRIVFL